jgi:transposase
MSELPASPPQLAVPKLSRNTARQDWSERLQRFAQSGLRPGPFCQREGVSLPSFYAWKRRLAAAAPSPAPEPTANADVGPRLLPVRLAPAAPIELLLPSGTLLRLTPHCDLAFVRSLVAALGDTSC